MMSNWQAYWFWLVDRAHDLLDFMSAGGAEMWFLAGVCVAFWTLTLGHWWFTLRIFPSWAKDRKQAWKLICQDEVSHSLCTRSVRSAWLSQAEQQLLNPLRLNRTLISLFPLLGLLGTVTGMISVFDVLSVDGAGNPRAMASGVWQATLPTLAGMVLAISGMFSLARLERDARRALGRLADQLRYE